MLRMAFLSPCLFALISCAPPDQGQGASGESTSMSHPYDLTVLANSACYVAGAQQTVRQEADKLIATRVLVKEPGMCAQARHRGCLLWLVPDGGKRCQNTGFGDCRRSGRGASGGGISRLLAIAATRSKILDAARSRWPSTRPENSRPRPSKTVRKICVES